MSEWETFCDESYYHLWRVRRKNERGFNDGYHIHNGDEARALVELLNGLEREREELKNQLIDAKSSTAFWMGKYNNAVQLRGKDPLCDSFWKTLDKLAAERALADLLAEALKELLYYDLQDVNLGRLKSSRDALSEWKEARFE